MSQPPFDPSNFFALATAILSHSQDESYLRTSLSRAYYACFHLARLGCGRKWSWSPPDYGQHRAVLRKLRDQRYLSLAMQLERLLELRERADYDLDMHVDDALCQKGLDIAKWLVPRLQSL